MAALCPHCAGTDVADGEGTLTRGIGAAPDLRHALAMARRCFVPQALRDGPFTIAEAQAAGVSKGQLRGSAWRRVCTGWYCWAGYPFTETTTLIPIARRLPEGFAFAGPVAARLHDLDVPLQRRPEVIVPVPTATSERVEAIVRREQLDRSEIVWRKGFPVTGPLRTCFDLAGRLPLLDAVVALDQALAAGLVDPAALEDFVTERAGANGVVKARRAISLAEPKSESPMETRLRLLLELNGLPRPEAQVDLSTPGGQFVARVDLFYPEPGLAIEYDGDNHRDRLVEDNRRQNRLLEIGVRLLRYTAPDLRTRPGAVVAEVRAALATRPHNASKMRLSAGL